MSSADRPKPRSATPMSACGLRLRRSTGSRARSSKRSPQSYPAMRVRDCRSSRRSTPNLNVSARSTVCFESPRGVALIETGRVAEGIRLIELTIARARRLRRPHLGRLRAHPAGRSLHPNPGGRPKAAGFRDHSKPPGLGGRQVSGRAPRRRASGSCGVTPAIQS